MKVAISAGGRFHAFRLAYELYKRDSLARFFTFSYGKRDKLLFPKNLVTNVHVCKCLDFLATKLRLSRVLSSSGFNVFQDNLFDYAVSRRVKRLGEGDIDIFVGWAHYMLKSIPAIKRTGAKIIIESGSCHILEQQKLLQEEYAKWGLRYQPIHKKNSEKMVAEYAAADYIMTLSEFAKQSFIKQGVSPEKILKVPCGMDIDYFRIGVPKREKFRVIFVGLLNVRKGIPYLLQAWSKLNLPEQDAELVLVGNMQKDVSTILRAQKNLNKKNIIFYGSVTRPALRSLLHSSSVFVLPSIEDGFGMVVGEAMASGLPVICSDHTGATDMIENGKQGFIVPAGDTDALAEKILWSYQNAEHAREMGASGQKTVQNFSWDAYGQNVYKTYEKVLSEKNTSGK